MTAAICGIGLVGGFGSGLADLERALIGDRVEPRMVAIPTREGEIPVPCLTASTARLAEYLSSRDLRRLSHYIRLGLLAAFDAMADARLLGPAHRGRLGIIVATGQGATGNTYAFQYPFEDREEICGSPTQFANSVHNAAAAYISITLREMGPNHSITQEDISFPSALLTAMTWLGQRRVDAVLVGGVDALSHAHAYAWHVHNERQRRQTPPESVCKAPLAGEGASFFVLKRAADARPTPYGRIEAVMMGRHRHGPPPRPTADCLIMGTGGVAATRADYGPWAAVHTRCLSYASVYGDLPVDSAFDLAIAARSHQTDTIYTDDQRVAVANALEPLAGRSIACLKLGVGNTYGWALLT